MRKIFSSFFDAILLTSECFFKNKEAKKNISAYNVLLRLDYRNMCFDREKI